LKEFEANTQFQLDVGSYLKCGLYIS